METKAPGLVRMKNRRRRGENMKNNFYLNRGYTAELRAAGEDENRTGSIIEGLAAVCEQETIIRTPFGEFVEIIKAGAFAKTDFSDVRLLVNHDMNGIPLARSRNNNNSNKPNTMQLSADDEGIHIRADIDTVNNEQARAAYSAVDRGDIDGMSFCFFVSPKNQRTSERDGKKVREILAVDKVIEVSIVTFPAYEGTNIDTRSLDSDKRWLDSFRALDSAKQKPDYRANAIMTMYRGVKNK